MKKIIAFIVGLPFFFLVTQLFLAVVLGLVSIPIIGLIYLIVGGGIGGISAQLFRWLFGEKPAPIQTEAGLKYPTQSLLKLYKYKVLEIILSFAAGILTSYVLFTAQDANPNGLWLRMTLLFLPIYAVAIVFIILALIRLNKLTSDVPKWLLQINQDGQDNKTPVIIRVASIVTILAIVCIPGVTIGVNIDYSQHMAAKYRADKQEKEAKEAKEEALIKSERDKQRTESEIKQQAEQKRLIDELNSSTLSMQWEHFNINGSVDIGFDYPSKWGRSKVTSEKCAGPLEHETHLIEFANIKTPYILIHKGALCFDKGTTKEHIVGSYIPVYKDAKGYTPKEINNTDYTINIKLEEAAYPELCDTLQDSGGNPYVQCRAGGFAADFNKLLSSVKTE